MIITTSTSSKASAIQSSATPSCVLTATPQRTSSASVESVCSTDSSIPKVARPRLSRGSCYSPDPCCSTDSSIPKVSRPRLSRGSCYSPDPCCSSDSSTPKVARPRLSRGSCYSPDPSCSQLALSSCGSSSSSTVFADYDSGVVFSGLYTASGESITAHEFETKPHRVLAPTLYLIIPDGNSSSSSSVDLPSFALTVPSPISPTHPVSPVLPPAPCFTRESYLAAAASAPPSSRVPSLPHLRCPHMAYLFPRNRWCYLCDLQQLACEVWWGSRGSMLSAPNIPPAASTPQTRAVYYALGLPLGRLERACVDLDDVNAISFMRLPSTRVRGDRSGDSSDTGIKSKVAAVARQPAPVRILRMFARRARHVLSAPTRVPMMPVRSVPRRLVVVRP